MADQPAETKKAANKDDEPEQSPYDAGDWTEGGRPPGATTTLVWYSVPGEEPAVRLGSCDGEFYNDAITGRSSRMDDVGGFKSVMSEAPADPGFQSPAQQKAKDDEAKTKDTKDTKDAKPTAGDKAEQKR